MRYLYCRHCGEVAKKEAKNNLVIVSQGNIFRAACCICKQQPLTCYEVISTRKKK